jgi:hypothetical protein
MIIFPHFKDGVPYVGAAGDSLTQLPLHPDVVNILGTRSRIISIPHQKRGQESVPQ